MATSRDNDGGNQNGRTRRDLISEAQLQTYRARQQCYRALSQIGGVPYEYRLNFQSAIIDYYWALRPLHEDDAIADWWEEVKLSDDWTEGGGEVPVVEGDLLDGVRIDTQYEEPEPVTGLDRLQDLEEDTETIVECRDTYRGEKRDEQTRQRVLPFRVLRDISAVLDDAATKLGFAPETPQPDSPGPAANPVDPANRRNS